MGDGTHVLSISNIIIILIYIVNCTGLNDVKLSKSKNSTFGFSFQRGMNLSCSKKFFNSLDEDDCRIYYVDNDDGTCGDFAILIPENREETEELNVRPNLFLRSFGDHYPSETNVGLNVTIPLHNNDTRGYLINFDIPSKLHRCQVIFINSPKPRKKFTLWNDQFFFWSDEDKYFVVKITEIPTGKQQTFHSKVPSEDILTYEADHVWKSLIFFQIIANRIIVSFTTAPFNVSGYIVELVKGETVVEDEIIAQNGDSIRKMHFYNLEADTYYCVRIKGNCERCQTSELCLNTTATEPVLLSIPTIIGFCASIFVVGIFMFLLWTQIELKPKFIRKPMIFQSYDCHVHAEFIFAKVKALNQCQCDVLVDKYRDAHLDYDIKQWIPEAITQCDCILIIWSKGALNKDNPEFELREPGNTISSNWNFAVNQIETKLNSYNLRIANVFWDKTIDPNQIKCVFKGYENIFLTNDLEKEWKKLISFIYAQDLPFWKRKMCRLYRQDLRKFDQGKELLKAYQNMKNSYELELIAREVNQNVNNVDDEIQLVNYDNVEDEENHDSGFDSRLSSVLNSVLSDENRMPSIPASSISTSPPQLSLQDALDAVDRQKRIEKPENSATLSNQSSMSTCPSQSTFSQPPSVPYWNQPTPIQQPLYAPVYTYPVMFVPQNPMFVNQNSSIDNSSLASNTTQSTNI